MLRDGVAPRSHRIDGTAGNGRGCAMMALLFLLYLVAAVLAVRDRKRPSLAVFTVALAVSLYWFWHHMSDPVTIAL